MLTRRFVLPAAALLISAVALSASGLPAGAVEPAPAPAGTAASVRYLVRYAAETDVPARRRGYRDAGASRGVSPLGARRFSGS